MIISKGKLNRNKWASKTTKKLSNFVKMHLKGDKQIAKD
jgi:hypothetical protein